MRSDSSARAVSMMIGIAAVFSSARSSRQTSSPSTCGSITSSTIKSGGLLRTASSASRPDATRVVDVSRLVEIPGDELRDVGIVLDHQDAGGHWRQF